ncbi:site-specific DNA-methyltransferase [Aliarcobacter butzleri]|uniref:site-specific DNA-methyltransferase (adenine-specific) n=1 Tax=Aliarcobacter butzleri TaxID=28197 RepID=A0AAW7Q7A8_9BACT|nr:site-specific DNA-methyltransferase [Aliarcobacter butzleri]MDN5114816.1 site-specific DNA-methyltransferase [Aliarcobacter butzleri]
MNFEKLDMKTINFTDENIKKIAEIFPNVVSEDENGKVIDFEALKQELSGNIVEGYKERYSLNWPGKREAQLKANTPTTKTLRPCIEESVNFDTTENLYIEGDNLDVLKILQEGYLNKIKMIYIDPPYNTGKDFVYKDNFTRSSEEELLESGQIDEDGGKLVANVESNGRYHSDWLSMMYPRLKLARNLLKEDGVIFISIDDNEVHNLRKICDEIFGENNFVAKLVWENKEGGGGSDSKLFRIKHEYCIVYAKNINSFAIFGEEINNEERYTEIDEFVDTRGRHLLRKLADNGLGYIASLDFPISDDKGNIVYPNKDGEKIRRWMWGKEKVEWGKKNGYIVFKRDNKGELTVYNKIYLKADNEGNPIERTKTPLGVINDYSTTKSTKKLAELFGKKVFDYSKPIEYISWLINRSLNGIERNIILDFFSGSATTAHSVMKLNSEDDGNRKFIMVQIPELTDEKSEAYKAKYKNICEIGKERIRRVGKKIVEESGKTDLDIGFRVLKLDSSNMKDIYFTPQELGQSQIDYSVDNIKDDRTDLDLLFGVLIDWGVDLTLPIIKETIQEKVCYFVDSDSLCAYFGNDINEEFIKELAKKEALRFVFKDSSFGNNDDLKDNVSQIFRQLNPKAEIKVI